MPNGLRTEHLGDITSKAQSWLLLNLPVFMFVYILFNVRPTKIRLKLHGAIDRPDSFVLMLRYCANLKAIRYESTSFNRIVADKSHRVVAA